MPRPAKSQWDFGELFGPSQTRRVLTVSELTQQVKRMLEQQVGAVWVRGEVSNLRQQASGHWYFTLKDAGAQLACVLFRGESGVARDCLADGRQVLAQGDLTVYEARGQHQLIVRALELQGLGALQQAYERLKLKLQAEGLFALERKRPLPALVYRLGVVTSPSAAAWHDVLSVLQRRFAGMEIVLAPCRVQGGGAAAEIAQALAGLNRFNATLPPPERLHALLVTRGGGSLEDLWAFNEEIVARAVAASALPVVSAVGHEIDFTICDLAADLRAPTPSAAAELLSEGMFCARAWVPQQTQALRALARQHLAEAEESFQLWQERLHRNHPRRRLELHTQLVDDCADRLRRALRQALREQTSRCASLTQGLQRVRPARLLARRAEQLQQTTRRVLELTRAQLEARRQRVNDWAARLRLLSPDNTLGRGYSITMDAATGRIVRQAAETVPGQVLETRLAKGRVRSRVEAGES